MKNDYYISVRGGLGKNLSLARFIASYKKSKEYKTERFFILSPYWDVFESCPAVDYVYKPEQLQAFLEDAAHDDGMIVIDNMYETDWFIKKEVNYTKAWARMLHLVAPKVLVDDFLDPVKRFPTITEDLQKFQLEDFAIMQFWGGQTPLADNNAEYNIENDPLKRAYPVELAQEFVNLYKKKYPERKIYLFSLPNEPELEHTEKVLVPYLTFYELAKHAKEFVSIDSSLQHLITGLCPGHVIWGLTHPDHFGYAENNNILQECRRDGVFYFTELGPSANRVDYISPSNLISML